MLDNNEDKNKIYKYIGLFFAVMVGAFLAVYFAITMAFNTLFNPFVVFHNMDKEMNKMEKEMIPADSVLPQHMRNYFEQESGNSNLFPKIRSGKVPRRFHPALYFRSPLPLSEASLR